LKIIKIHAKLDPSDLLHKKTINDRANPFCSSTTTKNVMWYELRRLLWLFINVGLGKRTRPDPSEVQESKKSCLEGVNTLFADLISIIHWPDPRLEIAFRGWDPDPEPNEGSASRTPQ